MKNIKDKVAFIIGTGPSLNKIDIKKLKGFPSITFNRAYLAFEEWGFDPKYYLAIDGNDIRSVYKDINNLTKNSNIEKMFLVKLNDNQLHEPSDFQDFDFKSNDEIYCESEKIFLMHNIGGTTIPQINDFDINGQDIKTTFVSNAGFMGLKMLYMLGYRRIYLLGMDARYKDDTSFRDVKIKGRQYTATEDNDVNHFRGDYFGKNITFGKPNESEIIGIWKNFMSNIKNYPDLEIFSCSENSNLNDFIKYVEFDEIIRDLSKVD